MFAYDFALFYDNGLMVFVTPGLRMFDVGFGFEEYLRIW